MFLTKRLSIQSKLILLLLVTSLTSLLTMAFIGYTSARDALKDRVFSQLTGYREARADMLGDYLKFLRGKALTLSEDRMVVDAVKEFRTAYQGLADKPLPPEQEERLKGYYREEYLPALAKNLDAKLALEAYLPRCGGRALPSVPLHCREPPSLRETVRARRGRGRKPIQSGPPQIPPTLAKLHQDLRLPGPDVGQSGDGEHRVLDRKDGRICYQSADGAVLAKQPGGTRQGGAQEQGQQLRPVLEV